MSARIRPLPRTARWRQLAAATLSLALLFPAELHAEGFSSSSSSGIAQLTIDFANNITVRAGDTRTVKAFVQAYGGQMIDYGTAMGDVDEVVARPWWLDYGTNNVPGPFGPDDVTIRWIYRGARQTYFHVTFWPSYTEANPGHLSVTVRGSWSTFTALPLFIAEGDAFAATAVGQDDDGMVSSVPVQISTDGGAWQTISMAGPGTGYSSTANCPVQTAGGAGTTYQWRSWVTDTNGYQSRIVYSPVYTTIAKVPATGYTFGGTDLAEFFKPRAGQPAAAATGLTCVIGGVTYDLADLFLPRRAGARPPVNFIAAGNNDVAAIFESKSEPTF